MFTLKKLKRLPEKTRFRKLILILQKAEIELKQGKKIESLSIKSIIEGLEDDFPENLKKNIHIYKQKLEKGYPLIRFLNMIRQSLLAYLNIEPAEWDFILPDTDTLDPGKRMILPAKVYLEDVRSPFNVGSIFRTAESFGISYIYLSENTPGPDHKRVLKTARGCTDVIPWGTASLPDIAQEQGIFALELGGTPIHLFRFPRQGIVLIGSEELGLSPEALELARKGHGCVSIPLAGAKRSLNVSVAFGILMYAWFSSFVERVENTG
ncbi:MAG: TrmH family RNA methyltransferase [Spirochaetales bacterium]|nr:TrmH family RNA methyltransferase [Spirochaetales bacterium]